MTAACRAEGASGCAVSVNSRHRPLEQVRPVRRDRLGEIPYPVPVTNSPMSRNRLTQHHRQSNPTELEQRVGYLEKLLTHHARITTLDSENLRRLAESIDKPPRGRRSPDVQSHSSGYLGVGDENCTVQPLENNITRRSPSCRIVHRR